MDTNTKPVVYVAGPYRRPDCCVNTHEAIKVADRLLEMGCVPLIPHLTHLWHTVSPKPDQVWLDLDLVLMKRCDAVFRFRGDSVGADEEVRIAEEHGLPVFYDYAHLERWVWGRSKNRLCGLAALALRSYSGMIGNSALSWFETRLLAKVSLTAEAVHLDPDGWFPGMLCVSITGGVPAWYLGKGEFTWCEQKDDSKFRLGINEELVEEFRPASALDRCADPYWARDILAELDSCDIRPGTTLRGIYAPIEEWVYDGDGVVRSISNGTTWKQLNRESLLRAWVPASDKAVA